MSPRKGGYRPRENGSIFPRGRKWAFKFYGNPDPLSGKKEVITRSGFETEDDAWEAMSEAKKAAKKGSYVKPSRATVADFFEQWFPYVRTTTEPTTAANYETLARSYVMPSIGHRPMHEVTPPVISALYEYLLKQGRRTVSKNWDMYEIWTAGRAAGQPITARELSERISITYSGARRAIRRYEHGQVPDRPNAGLSQKSVQSVHIMLKTAMATATIWKFVDANPAVGVKAPTVGRTPHRTWSPDEMARFLEAARSDRFYALWVLIATTGMRRSELCGVRRNSADLDRAEISMRSTRVLVGNTAQEGSGKSRRSRRLMALDGFTVAVLKEHIARLDQERRDFGSGYQDHGLLFCWEDGRPVYPGTVNQRFERIIREAGIPRITPHGIRHSYATIALRSGVHPKVVSSRLGHATVAFTLDTYSEDVPDLDKAAASDISALYIRRPDSSSDDARDEAQRPA
jgi:integrase